MGDPSEKYLLGTLAGKDVVFLAAPWPRPSHFAFGLNFRANIPRLKSLDASASLAQRGRVVEEEHRPLEFVIPVSSSTVPAPRLHFLRRRSVATSALPIQFGPQLSQVLFDSCQSQQSKPSAADLSLHGRPGLLHQGGVNVSAVGAWTVIGMTNLQEAKLAREAEICYVLWPWSPITIAGIRITTW